MKRNAYSQILRRMGYARKIGNAVYVTGPATRILADVGKICRTCLSEGNIPLHYTGKIE